MIIRNLDSNGDWTFGRGVANYLTNDDATRLNIQTRLYSWVGDCFFDQRAGIDWTNRLGLKNQKDLLALELKKLILTSYGVTGITSFDIVINEIARSFSASYTINTIFGMNYRDQITLGS